MCPSNLVERLFPFLEQGMRFSSRTHALKTFGKNAYVKRDDELGFGVSGCKFRKYLSLLPALVKRGVEIAILKGGPYSNHLVSFSQILIEKSITPVVFFPESKVRKLQGNFLLLKTLLNESDIHLAPLSQLEQARLHFLKEGIEKNKNVEVVEEGGSQKDSLLGALTLAIDILNNEEENNTHFHHLFIESGTGFSAHLLILGMALLDPNKTIHCLLVAGNENEFMKNLMHWKKELENLLSCSISQMPSFTLYKPQKNSSFGSTSPQLFQFIKEIAKEEGFFTDPIYSAKLFSEFKSLLSSFSENENKLFIHSGGALTLLGFQEDLSH